MDDHMHLEEQMFRMTKAYLFFPFQLLLLNVIAAPFLLVLCLQVCFLTSAFNQLLPHMLADCGGAGVCVGLLLLPGIHPFGFTADLAQTLPWWPGRSQYSQTTRPISWLDANSVYLAVCCFLWLKVDFEMPVNCKLAYDWPGAIKFLSNHFWFRKHSAILETSNIYLCLTYFIFLISDEINLLVFHMGTKQGPL